MRFWPLSFFIHVVLLLPIFFAPAMQAESAQGPGSGTSGLPSTETLPRDYPVITIQGVCAAAAPRSKAGTSTAACKTVVTRSEFEKVVNALSPRMTKFERRQLVDNYAQILVFSHEATRTGLDKDPRVAELLRYTRLRVLAAAMNSKIRRDAVLGSEQEEEAYYQHNQRIFERFTLQRIFVPREKQGEATGGGMTQNVASDSSEPAMKALAESIQKRAQAGEDFDKLQKEVFEQSGIKAEAKTSMTEIGRGSLAEGHNQMLELPPGKVSSLFTDPSGYYVYKVVSKHTPPFNAIKDEVEISLKEKKTAEAMARIENPAKTQINEDYFNRYDPPAPDPNEPETDED